MFDHDSWASEIWWNVLAEVCACTNFVVLRISWGKFKDLMSEEDEDIVFNGLYKGTIVLTLEGCFLTEWENKGWDKSWHEVSKLETTRLMSRTRRLRKPSTCVH